MAELSIERIRVELSTALGGASSVAAGGETKRLRLGIFSSTDSTMEAAGRVDSASALIEAEMPAWPARSACGPLICALSLEQTGGRGRFNRRWVSPLGAGIYLTLSFETALAPAELPPLSLAAGLGAAAAARACGAEAVLKWPNDVLVRRGGGFKKIAGVLLETAPAPHGTKVLIGAGLNRTHDPAAAAEGGISLTETAGREIGYSEAAAALIVHLYSEIGRYFGEQLATGGRESMFRRWWAMSMMDGVIVTFTRGGSEAVGRACGIDNDGALIVESDGGKHKVISGEVKLSDAAGL